jgi:hypothetical protein
VLRQMLLIGTRVRIDGLLIDVNFNGETGTVKFLSALMRDNNIVSRIIYE